MSQSDITEIAFPRIRKDGLAVEIALLNDHNQEHVWVVPINLVHFLVDTLKKLEIAADIAQIYLTPESEKQGFKQTPHVIDVGDVGLSVDEDDESMVLRIEALDGLEIICRFPPGVFLTFVETFLQQTKPKSNKRDRLFKGI